MSSDVIKCHTGVCFTACCIPLFLQSQNHAMKEEGVHGPRHAASVALQSDHRRILCSNEQSKLCPCPTKSLLSDKDQLARPWGGGIRSKVADSGKEKKYKPTISCIMEKTTGTRTGRKPKNDPADRKYSFRLNLSLIHISEPTRRS